MNSSETAPNKQTAAMAAPSANTAATSRGPCEIFATQGQVNGKATLRVYLACDKKTAEKAVEFQTFSGVWAPGRMSWVKPSAAWMAYRCGWTVHKDRKQTNVLALDVDREKFEGLLLQAVVSHGDDTGRDAVVEKGRLKPSPCVVQWDPERELDPGAIEKKDSPYLRKLVGVRSLQVGLRNDAWDSFFTDSTYILRLSDETARFRAAHEALKAGDLGAAQAALWPDPAMVERRLDASPHVRKAIRIVSEAEREPRGSQAAPRGEAEPQRPLEQPASRDEGAVRKELKEEPADAPEPAPQASTPPASQSTSQAPPPSEAAASAEM